MNDGAGSNSERRATPSGHSAFAPLLLMLIGWLTVLAWNLSTAIRQTATLQAAKIQIMQATAQSDQATVKLQNMLSDLIKMSEHDAAAAAIIKRYRIQQNAPTSAAPKANPAAKAGGE